MDSKRACPYCGSEHLTDPRLAIKDEATIKLFQDHGLPIPMIRDCEDCTATLGVESFEVGSEAFNHIASKKGYEMLS